MIEFEDVLKKSLMRFGRMVPRVVEIREFMDRNLILDCVIVLVFLIRPHLVRDGPCHQKGHRWKSLVAGRIVCGQEGTVQVGTPELKNS